MPRRDRAFARTYRRHVADVYHYALGVLRDPHDAEEVTRTTFQNGYREFCRRGGRPPRLNALLAIAHEICRVRGRHERLAEADLSESELSGTPAAGMSCPEAEHSVFRALDDGLSRKERRLLRTHLRSCEDCEAFARRQQAQRDAIRALASIPVPATLQSFFADDERRAAPTVRPLEETG